MGKRSRAEGALRTTIEVEADASAAGGPGDVPFELSDRRLAGAQGVRTPRSGPREQFQSYGDLPAHAALKAAPKESSNR
jgi:hypothetical protein